MYGFVEKELADILVSEGLITSYEPYSTSGDGSVAILDKEIFDLVFATLSDYSGHENIVVLNSSIAGMKIMLYPYWMHEELFDILTPGDIKETEMYLNIRTEPSTTRFEWLLFMADFTLRLRERAGLKEEEQNTTSADANTPSGDTSDGPTETDVAKWVKDFCHKWSYDCKNIEVDGKILAYHFNSILLNKDVCNICKATKRSVVVFRRQWSTNMPTVLRELKTKFGRKFEKEILFIHTKLDHPRILSGYMSEMPHHIFGHEVKDLYQLHSNSEQARGNPRGCGPEFGEFDYVYRDYKTGMIWALQKGSEIFLMMNLSGQPLSFQEILIKELTDRFDGALPYEEMVRRDNEYFNMISTNDKNAFVEMAVRNSNYFVKELKQHLLHAKESYKEAIDKAMEHAKIAQRLEENLVRLDEKKFEEEEKERCNKMFEDVLTIPKVSAVKVADNVVNVYTKNLYVQHDVNKKWHDVGTFHIQIGMYESSYSTQSTVKVFNTKHQMSAFNEHMQAPHVFEDGHICHGNLVGGMVDAYKRRDMYQMVLMILMFLQSANLDDSAGAYLSRWPEVSEEVATKPDKEEGETVVLFEEQAEEESKFDAVLDIPIHI